MGYPLSSPGQHGEKGHDDALSLAVIATVSGLPNEVIYRQGRDRPHLFAFRSGAYAPPMKREPEPKALEASKEKARQKIGHALQMLRYREAMEQMKKPERPV